MKRALILAQGRIKEPYLRQACDEYYKRCGRTLQILEREVRHRAALKAAVPERSIVIALDEQGQQVSSRGFAQHLQQWIEQVGTPIVFVIGGADGLDDALRRSARFVLSLGPMTFAHRLVRLILAEQLYRAVSILEGSPYHRA